MKKKTIKEIKAMQNKLSKMLDRALILDNKKGLPYLTVPIGTIASCGYILYWVLGMLSDNEIIEYLTINGKYKELTNDIRTSY
jgi:hypothetical protein